MKFTNAISKTLFGAGVAISFGLVITSTNQALAQGACVPPPSGLIGWWDADSVSGTTATDIKGGNDGTILGGVAIVPGKVGDAFSFAGGSEVQEINLPFDSGDVFTDQFTVDAWAFPTKLYTFSNGGAILINDDQITLGPGHRGMVFGVFGGLTLPRIPFQLTAGFSNTDGGQFIVEAPTTPNVFHHYAATYDGSQFCLYQDGIQEVCVAASGNVNDNDLNFKIAGRPNFPDPARHYGGLIDEVEIFDRALSAAEIQAIYDAGSAGKCKSPLAVLVVPNTVDFGQVDAFTSQDMIVTVSNIGSADLDVNDVAVTDGMSNFMVSDIDLGPPPFTLAPGDDAFVTVTFFPTAEGVHLGTLTVDSADPDQPMVEVSLIGNGLIGAVDDQATALEAAVGDAIAFGGLVGSGSGNSSSGRLNAFDNMIEAAGDLIEAGFIEDACGQLRSALRRVDGEPRPPDFATGDDAALIADQIRFLRTSLGCS